MDFDRILNQEAEIYRRRRPNSEKFFKHAGRFLIGGGSHTLRLFRPFPFYDQECRGAWVKDIDGHTYIDFWQGHFGNVLGHNPPVVIEALQENLRRGQGLNTGFPGLYQEKLAGLLAERAGFEKIRFTTSGTLSSMYAIMLARSFTGRSRILKVGGGWHGSQPYALKGIKSFRLGLDHMESAGLSADAEADTIMTRFNDQEDLKEKFDRFGESIACLIVEPFIGSGGFIFGDKPYIQTARKLTDKHGALLILDEVISGFRFHAGALQSLYQVKGDLTVLGKTIGGGMPVSAVAGRSEIMELCRNGFNPQKKVKCEGGTFSAHPSAMLAGYTFIKYLIDNEKTVYSQIGRLGTMAREGIERIFHSHGFRVKCSGDNKEVVPHSSVAGVHFLKKDLKRISSPEDVWDPKINDFQARESVFKLALLNEGFNVFHGFGAVSSAHTHSHITSFLEAVERVAGRWRKFM